MFCNVQLYIGTSIVFFFIPSSRIVAWFGFYICCSGFPLTALFHPVLLFGANITPRMVKVCSLDVITDCASAALPVQAQVDVEHSAALQRNTHSNLRTRI